MHICIRVELSQDPFVLFSSNPLSLARKERSRLYRFLLPSRMAMRQASLSVPTSQPTYSQPSPDFSAICESSLHLISLFLLVILSDSCNFMVHVATSLSQVAPCHASDDAKQQSAMHSSNLAGTKASRRERKKEKR